MWYTHAAEQYSSIKRSHDTGKSMNEPQKRDAKSKKPDAKGYILHDHSHGISRTCKFIKQKAESSGCQELEEGRGGWRLTAQWGQDFLWSDENVLVLDESDSYVTL